MKRVLQFAGLIMASLAAMISCDRSEVELPDSKLVFELYENQEKFDEGTPISGVQGFFFDDTKTYILQSAYVTSIVIDDLRGWDCKFYPATGEAVLKREWALALLDSWRGFLPVDF